MSYLSELKNHQISLSQFVGKSVVYLQTKLGLTVSDKAVDEATASTTKFVNDLEGVALAWIQATLPALPAAVATAAANAALNVVDAAIAGAGNVIKDATPDEPAA